MFLDSTERQHLEMLHNGWRLVQSKKRKRKLEKRGETVIYSSCLVGWLWLSDYGY